MSSRRRALSALAVVAAACSGAKKAEPPVGFTAPSSDEASVAFQIYSIDERPITSQTVRGKPTVMAFATTGGIKGQAQLNFLVIMAKHDEGKNNYVFVALEPRDNRQLVEEYKRFLGITFPIGMADDEMLQGLGPFGDVRAEPTTIILDRQGRVVFRAQDRVVKADELRATLGGL